MIRFNSDYTEGCHPAILEKLSETNMEQTAGYGEDEYCAKAAELIKKACKSETADVHFLVGGTQTNVTVISAALKHYQGVLTAESGHINVHETGALEACGHKCLCLQTPDGKLTAENPESEYSVARVTLEDNEIISPYTNSLVDILKSNTIVVNGTSKETLVLKGAKEYKAKVLNCLGENVSEFIIKNTLVDCKGTVIKATVDESKKGIISG